MDKCPWCNADARDTFSFVCGSVRPSYVTPSAMQADSCRIAILKAKLALSELAAQTHGCHGCGEERPARIVAGKLTCPECGSEDLVCLD